MIKVVIIVDKNDDIKDVVKFLCEYDIFVVFVFDNGKVVGFVGFEDIVDYFIKM